MRDRDGEGQNYKHGGLTFCSIVSGTGTKTQQIAAKTALHPKAHLEEVPALAPMAMHTKEKGSSNVSDSNPEPAKGRDFGLEELDDACVAACLNSVYRTNTH